MTVGELLIFCRDRLKSHGVEDGNTISQWLVSDTTALPYDTLQLHVDRSITDSQRDRTLDMLERCVTGEPVQYVVGYTEFFNCKLSVGPGVLIPRPETEQLVERALELWNGGPVLDLCTGSGCIPLAMAVEKPNLGSLIGVDLSEDALEWAEKNLALLGVKTVEFMESDLFDAVSDQTFELITANPPYVNPRDRSALATHVVDHEPMSALFADDSGMAIITRIVSAAPNHLDPEGWLIMEVGHDQGERVADLFRNGGFDSVRTLKDFAGHDRMVEGRWV